MNEGDEWDVLSLVRMLWPHSTLGSDSEAVAALWAAELKPYAAEAVGAAIRELSRQGREHAPPLGVIIQAVETEAQDPPPSFEEVVAFISRHAARCLPYGERNTPEDTLTAIENLTRAGAHEAILRFVAEQGVYAVRTMPDGSLYPLDMNQQADRRDKAREYRSRTLEGWRADPTPGLALARTQRRLEAGRASSLSRLRITGPSEE